MCTWLWLDNANVFLQVQNATEEKEIECNYLVNACGPWAAELALMAGIGRSDHTCHIMRTRLPVEPRLRSVFVFKCPTDLPNCPLVIAKNIYWRRESTGTFLAGYVPSKVSELELSYLCCMAFLWF